MFDPLSELALALTWRSVLIGALIFLGTFLLSLAIVSIILVKLPADHFSQSHKTKLWSGPNPALHAAKVIGKNVLGVLLVIVGSLLLFDKLNISVHLAEYWPVALIALGVAKLLTVTTFGFPLMVALVSAVVVPSTNIAGLAGHFPFVIYFLLSE